MFQLPGDEELYALLPGTGPWPDNRFGTMAELYDKKMVQVKSDTAAGCTGLSEDCIRQRQRDAMGRWVQGYLRQRRPIGAYPTGEPAPGMTEAVGDAVRQLRLARKKLEDTRPRQVLRKLGETALLFVLTQLFWQGVLACEAAISNPAPRSTAAGLSVFLLGAWAVIGVVLCYVSFVSSAAGSVIMLVRLADRQQTKEEFLISVNDNVYSAYLYLRFCQLWFAAQSRKLPEDLSFGLKEVNKAVRLYNCITETPAAT